ncbi:MAG TPA: hypothetical protein VF247_09495 [Candidatus Krumholzibacteria bacterium]
MKHSIVMVVLTACLCASLAHAAEAPAADPLQSPEGVVRELYRLVCVPAGGDTDWNAVRALFIPEAVIVLRVSKDASSTFTLQGWIDDFIAFNTKAKSSERGFEEKIVRMSPMVFRDIAHVLVLYEARMLDWTRPASQGVDSIELIRKGDRWWIAAITNDLPNEEHPVPAALKD